MAVFITIMSRVDQRLLQFYSHWIAFFFSITSWFGWQVPGMAYGPMGIAGVGLDPDEPQPPDAPGMAASGAGGRFRTQSLLYIDDLDNYWNRPPLSRPISTALIVSPKFASPSFDRQSQFVTTSTKRPQPAPAPNQRNVDRCSFNWSDFP